ncbi:hypothetical protein [Colwellia sp. MB3u-55]|uniref:hypothetical protein n=1 Tax=Colwellia sp. MB3u-55 TaxID=2759810 RepID=UPI0015F53AFD|nr:hypothetical protein [Colwellia sp. MB3u-55]MBA6252068.1 hypothetical protein [Colwellia sp. MB3u-55]
MEKYFLNNIINKASKAVGHLIEICLFLVVVSLAIGSITEISARDSFLSTVKNEINFKNEIAAQSTIKEGKELTNQDLQMLKNDISYFKSLVSRVEALISLGAERKSQTLINIRENFERIAYKDEELIATSILFYFQRNLSHLSSDYLLAIAIMTCGAIGGSIGAMRNTSGFYWRSILFGLSSGFVVFLAIKGGKSVFLMQMQGQTIQFNPFSSGFLGFISGLFTEKVFDFLSTVTDSVFKKLKKVFEE